LSLLFLELNGYGVNAAQLHVHAADVLVRPGIAVRVKSNETQGSAVS